MLGRILVFLGGLLVVVLFVALLAPLFVNWTDFRNEFEIQASRILGKKVVVHGDLDARILPFPSVTLHDVRVGHDMDGTPLVQVARFSMDMELAPFLSGEARIFDVRIEEPKARIRLSEDGTLDWMRGSRASIPARTVVLEDVHITGGEIEFIDEQSGRNRRITNLDADMSAKSLAGPWRAEGRGVVDGHSGGFLLTTGEPNAEFASLPVRLRLVPDAQPVGFDLDGVLDISEGRPEYRGHFALTLKAEENDTEHPVEPAPRVGGQFELTNERIRIPEYRLEIGAHDNPYVVTGEATLDTGVEPDFLLTAEGQQIDVSRIASSGPEGKTGRKGAMSGRQRLNALIGLASDIPIPQVPGRASLRLPAIVAGDTTIRDIRLDVRPAGRGWTVENAVAILPGRTQVEAKGALRLEPEPSFAGDLLFASSQPSGLAAWLSGDVDPAIRRLRSAGFSAKVNLMPQLQRFEGLEVIIGGANLKGRMERQSIEGQTPNLSVELAGNEIDLDAMRALSSLLTGDEAGDNVLDHRIAAKLKANRFNAFGIGAENVETVFTLAEGGLSLQQLKIGDLAGAAISARGEAEGSLLSYRGNGVLDFKTSDPGPFLSMLRDRLPEHPVLDTLAANAMWFADTDVQARAVLGGESGSEAKINLSGYTNGSRLGAELTFERLFDLTGDNGMALSLRLENPDTSVLFGQVGLEPLPFEADSNGVLTLDVREKADELSPLQLTFRTDSTDLTLDGAFNLAASGFFEGAAELALESADIEPYLIMNGISVPQLGAGLPVLLAAKLDVGAEEIKLEGIEATLAGNRARGEVRFDRKATVATANGSLVFDTLDLAWLGETVFGPVTDPETGALSAKPVSLPLFGTADIALDLQANRFWPGVYGPADDFAARLVHRNGSLTLDEMTARWLGGDVSGRIFMSNGEGAGIFRSRLALSDGDLAQVVWAANGGPRASGRFDLDVVAEATAASPAGIVSALGGSGELRIRELSVNGLNSALLEPLLASADGIEGEVTENRVLPLVEAVVWNGSSTFGDVTVPFNISDGEVRAQNVTAANDLASISGNARIALDTFEVGAELEMQLATGDHNAVEGAQAVQRIVYFGVLEHPFVELDGTGITNFLSLRAFERERRRVETLQANVLEKQRLRREVALYRYRDAERQAARERAEAEERARLEEERQRALAEEEARKQAEEAAAERRRRAAQEPVLQVAPLEEVIRQELPPTPGFQNMPGVQQP